MGPYDYGQKVWPCIIVVSLFDQLFLRDVLQKLTHQPQLPRAYKLLHELDHAYPFEVAKYEHTMHML